MWQNTVNINNAYSNTDLKARVALNTSNRQTRLSHSLSHTQLFHMFTHIQKAQLVPVALQEKKGI